MFKMLNPTNRPKNAAANPKKPTIHVKWDCSGSGCNESISSRRASRRMDAWRFESCKILLTKQKADGNGNQQFAGSARKPQPS